MGVWPKALYKVSITFCRKDERWERELGPWHITFKYIFAHLSECLFKQQVLALVGKTYRIRFR